MAKNETTSAIIDGLLRFVAFGGVLSIGLMTPNALQALDKPLQTYFNRLDKRAREREFRRLRIYMKQKGLIAFTSEDYEHGITLTKTGKKRLQKAKFDNLLITQPKKWDKQWRLVFFDIPESKRHARRALTSKLRLLGFQQLQRSAWIHPFPCRPEIEVVARAFDVSKYLTYIETSYIDNQKLLRKRFLSLL